MDKGILYIVATPIGNLSDISERSLAVFKEVDFIACEDTRVSSVLLNRFNISKKLVSYHKFNENSRAESIINELLSGKSCALITDAGTPCISDPGYIIVREAWDKGLQIIGLPGPCAAVTALSVSGFDTAAYAFYGFFPRGKKAISDKLKEVFEKDIDTFVFYESPLRIIDTLEAVNEFSDNVNLCLCNDLTKKFEKIYRGRPGHVISMLKDNPNADKGEYTLVINYSKPAGDSDDGDIEQMLPSTESLLVDIMIKEKATLKDAIGVLHEKNKELSKKDIYNASLRLKNLFNL